MLDMKEFIKIMIAEKAKPAQMLGSPDIRKQGSYPALF